MPQGEEAVSGLVSGNFGIFACIGFNRRDDAEKCIRLVCEKLAVFPYARYIPLNSASYSLSYDMVRFKIEEGWKRNSCAKCIKTNATRPLRQ